MKQYTEQDLIRLAKRFHNTKRTYLLVDPLQGKHISVSPSEALKLFYALGDKVREEYGDAGLVIGFAETATAIGVAVAERMGAQCFYIHTSREEFAPQTQWIEFCEEHSHAVEQKLVSDGLEELLKSTECVVFVDDEISTGKTLINFVEQLKKVYPQIGEKELVAASIINRVSAENSKKMQAAGLSEAALLKIEETDYAEAVAKYTIHEAQEPAADAKKTGYSEIRSDVALLDPRLGVGLARYRDNCRKFAAGIIAQLDIAKGEVLVLGTEECMYPAMVLGKMLEEKGELQVYTHATTRSPIGICADPDYPIQSGYKLKSLYEEGRDTYIYGLRKYDMVLIVTDSKLCPEASAASLVNALAECGNDTIYLIRG